VLGNYLKLRIARVQEQYRRNAHYQTRRPIQLGALSAVGRKLEGWEVEVALELVPNPATTKARAPAPVPLALAKWLMTAATTLTEMMGTLTLTAADDG
jgi:hypothetical protein